MKYSLRSLMIAVLVLPPLLAAIWFALGHERFSIRELLLLTVIVGLALGWFLERRARVAIQAEHGLPHRQQQAVIAERAATALPTSSAPAQDSPKP